MQYISLPSYHWQVLREKFPGKYENKLTNSIDPESWFHVKVMVADEIAVYVNNHLHPSLIVKQLNTRSTGNIGFWVGNNSDADFANLVIHNH